MKICTFALTGMASALCCSMAYAQGNDPSIPTHFKGPYDAEVLRVIDGDTLEVKVAIWPRITSEVSVRVRGVDAPEFRRAGCAEEKALGEAALKYVERRYSPGASIRLENIGPDAFSGRVVADVRRWRSDRWLQLANELIEDGHAVAWEPDQNDVPWCLLGATE